MAKKQTPQKQTPQKQTPHGESKPAIVAHPPRPNRVLLAICVCLWLAWVGFLIWLAWQAG